MNEANGAHAALYFAVSGLLSSLDPGAAMGALFGSLFFLAMPSPTFNSTSKFLLWIFSCGLGYAAGIGVTAFSGWERLGMFMAMAFSSLGCAVFASLHNYQNGGPIPAWVTVLLDRIPFLNKRGD